MRVTLLAGPQSLLAGRRRACADKEQRVPDKHLVELGTDRGRGNLLGAQPFLRPMNYSSGTRFRACMDAVLDAAAARGWLRPDTLALFPEHIGTFLSAADGKPSMYTAPTLSACGRIAALSAPAQYLRALLRSRSADRLTEALLRMKAASTARIYQETFASLAARRGITIAAGSVALPSPSVKDGRIVCGGGPLYNASFVFRPDGSLHEIPVLKAYPTSEELRYIAPGRAADLPVFETPAGRMGVLICADAWFPECYARMRKAGARIILTPSFSEEKSWEGSWRGYSGWPNPPDVDSSDIGKISQQEAVDRYALGGRLPASGIPSGLMVCFRGEIWGWNVTCGQPVAVLDGQARTLPSSAGAAVINAWL